MDKRRLESNRVILDILKNYIEEYPDMRFSQALFNLNIIRAEIVNGNENISIVDDYYLEPWDLLSKMEAK
jgi:hypothetical protein